MHTENYETLMIEIKTDTISGEKSMLMDEMLMIKCPYGLCFPIFPSLPFLCAPQAFLKCTTKPYLYTQIERVHIIYILGNLRVFP